MTETLHLRKRDDSRRIGLAALAVLTLLAAGPATGAEIAASVLTNNPITLETDACAMPAPKSFVAVTDRAATLFLRIKDLSAGDLILVRWLRPGWRPYRYFEFNRVAGAGSWCFATSIAMAGAKASSYPGEWPVQIFRNGHLLHSMAVTVALSGGDGAAGCNFLLSPSAQPFDGGGGSNTLLLTTLPGCAWSAVSNTPWVVIEAGDIGFDSGTVRIRAEPNYGEAPRTGSLRIAGGTVAVTQGAAEPCSYLLAPSTSQVPAGGRAGDLTVVASGESCAWAATSESEWITITEGTDGTGSGSVQYAVAPNQSPTPRTGALTIEDRIFRLEQAGAPAATGIRLDGVLNAASGMPADLPAGGVARGSFFSLYGSGIGPDPPVQAQSFPLPTTLGEVSVVVRQGNEQVSAILYYVSQGQVNGIMPSNAPLGEGVMRLTYGGIPAEFPVRVVNHSFGVFSLAGGRGPGIIQNWLSETEQPLNTVALPAEPGRIAILWGTGLGPITQADNDLPPVGDLPYDTEILVAGQPAKKLYSGRAPCCAAVDEVIFEVPAQTPPGCDVPVQVRVADVFSNTVTMAVGETGQRCADTWFPIAEPAPGGRTTGAIALVRTSITGSLGDDGATEALDMNVDLGFGLFTANPGEQVPGFPARGHLPPTGACVSFTDRLDSAKLIGSILSASPSLAQILGLAPDPESRGLDAGPGLVVESAAGAMPIYPGEIPGFYFGALGGEGRQVPGMIPGNLEKNLIGQPPFFGSGLHGVQGVGGRDVGPFERSFSWAAPLVWTNRAETTTVRRGQAIPFTWAGGQEGDLLLIGGFGMNGATGTTGGFLCVERAAAGGFQVPPAMTANMPRSGPAWTTDGHGGLLGIATLPVESRVEFTARGLERGVLFASRAELRTVSIE